MSSTDGSCSSGKLSKELLVDCCALSVDSWELSVDSATGSLLFCSFGSEAPSVELLVPFIAVDVLLC